MNYSNMDNSLRIMLYILPLLVNSDELNELMDTRNIIAIVQNPDIPYPFVVFDRSSITTTYTKPMAGGFTNEVVFTFTVWDEDYERSVEIANIIRDILELREIDNDEIRINEIHLDSANEGYANDAYFQSLQFRTKVE